MTLAVRKESNAVVATLDCDLVLATAMLVRDTMRQLIEEQKPILLVLNMEKVKEVDSVGMGVLVAIRNRVDQYQGALRLCCVSGKIMQDFSKIGFPTYFLMFSTEALALKAHVRKLI